MSKARDLANAGTALTTVSATELGFLDGVTSAVQTQVDAKIAKTLTTTTGDIIYASSANTPARLGIGSSAQVLSVSGGVPAWTTPAGGGKVLQVVNATYSTQTATTSTTFADTGLTATITPTSSTSKVLVLVNHSGNSRYAGSANGAMELQLLRGSTSIITFEKYFGYNGSSIEINGGATTTSYLDSPATTSATIYKTQLRIAGGGTTGTFAVQANGGTSTITLIEIGA